MKPKITKLIILIVLLLGIGVGSFFLIKQITEKPTQSTDENNPKTSVLVTLTSDQLNQIRTITTEETKNLLTKIATEMSLASDCLENNTMYDLAISREINYQKPDQKFGLQITKNCAIIDAKASFDKLTNWLNILQKYNLKPTTAIDVANVKALSQNRHSFTFTSPEFVCGLTFLYHENGLQFSALSCVDNQQIEQIYHTLAPAVETYVNLANTEAAVHTPFVDTDSLRAKDLPGGYTRLIASFTFDSNKRLTKLFYRTPNQNWHFFNTSDQKCSDFNTAELKKIFAGINCKNQNGEDSTVEP